MSVHRSRTAASRTRRGRPGLHAGILVLGLVAGTALVAGCEANARATPIAPMEGDWIQPLGMNSHGLVAAVASSPTSNGIGHAALYDTATGRTTRLPDPPQSADLPDGGTFERAVDVNDSGVVVGAVTTTSGGLGRTAVYDTVSGAWAFPDCGASQGALRGRIDDAGRVVCGSDVFETATETYVPVPMPDDCDGQAMKINDSGSVVGYCESGHEPLFVADLASGTSIGFGSDLGIVAGDLPQSYWENSFGVLTDSGYLVIDTYPPDGSSRVHVYQVPQNPASYPPTSVDLGILSGLPTIGYAISENGILAVNVAVGDTWGLVSYDVVTGRLRAYDTTALGSRAHQSATFTTGVDDMGHLVGFQVDPTSDMAYNSFAVSPT